MPDWFETTGDSYFKHVNRTTIELSVAEARGSDAELSVRAAAKKSEAVTVEDRLVAGSGWIPAPVRRRQNRSLKARASPKTSSSPKRLSNIGHGPVTFLPRDRHSRFTTGDDRGWARIDLATIMLRGGPTPPPLKLSPSRPGVLAFQELVHQIASAMRLKGGALRSAETRQTIKK